MDPPSAAGIVDLWVTAKLMELWSNGVQAVGNLFYKLSMVCAGFVHNGMAVIHQIHNVFEILSEPGSLKDLEKERDKSKWHRKKNQ